MRINWNNAVLALSLVRFGQELGTGGRLAPLVAEGIDLILRLIR
jgi:small basic protein